MAFRLFDWVLSCVGMPSKQDDNWCTHNNEWPINDSKCQLTIIDASYSSDATDECYCLEHLYIINIESLS